MTHELEHILCHITLAFLPSAATRTAWQMPQTCKTKPTQLIVIYRVEHVLFNTHYFTSSLRIHGRIRHDWFIFVTWLIHVCDMTHSCVWHDSFIYVTWRIYVCDVTHSRVWHDSLICKPDPSMCVPEYARNFLRKQTSQIIKKDNTQNTLLCYTLCVLCLLCVCIVFCVLCNTNTLLCYTLCVLCLLCVCIVFCVLCNTNTLLCYTKHKTQYTIHTQ